MAQNCSLPAAAAVNDEYSKLDINLIIQTRVCPPGGATDPLTPSVITLTFEGRGVIPHDESFLHDLTPTDVATIYSHHAVKSRKAAYPLFRCERPSTYAFFTPSEVTSGRGKTRR